MAKQHGVVIPGATGQAQTTAALVLGAVAWPILFAAAVFGYDQLAQQLLAFRCANCGYYLNPYLLVYGVLPGAAAALGGLKILTLLQPRAVLRPIVAAGAGIVAGLLPLMLWILVMAGPEGIVTFTQGHDAALLITALSLASGVCGVIGGAIMGTAR